MTLPTAFTPGISQCKGPFFQIDPFPTETLPVNTHSSHNDHFQKKSRVVSRGTGNPILANCEIEKPHRLRGPFGELRRFLLFHPEARGLQGRSEPQTAGRTLRQIASDHSANRILAPDVNLPRRRMAKQIMGAISLCAREFATRTMRSGFRLFFRMLSYCSMSMAKNA